NLQGQAAGSDRYGSGSELRYPRRRPHRWCWCCHQDHQVVEALLAHKEPGMSPALCLCGNCAAISYNKVSMKFSLKRLPLIPRLLLAFISVLALLHIAAILLVHHNPESSFYREFARYFDLDNERN